MNRSQPFFETSVSHFIKPALHCLDLGTEEAVSALAKFAGVAKSPEQLAKQGTYWHHDGEPGVIAALKDRRLPPLVPEEFARRAMSKVLTNGKDKEVLLRLQAAVATTVLGSVREVSFAGLGWGDEDAALLAKALPMCAQLVSLDLVRNPFGGGDGAQRLAAALRDTPTLENVSGIPLKELRADRLTTLDLQQKNLGALEAMVMADLLRSVSASVTECNVRGNQLDAESATLLAKVAQEKRIMLFGIKHDQTEANFQSQGLGPVSAILLASDLLVSPSVTSVWTPAHQP